MAWKGNRSSGGSGARQVAVGYQCSSMPVSGGGAGFDDIRPHLMTRPGFFMTCPPCLGQCLPCSVQTSVANGQRARIGQAENPCSNWKGRHGEQHPCDPCLQSSKPPKAQSPPGLSPPEGLCWWPVHSEQTLCPLYCASSSKSGESLSPLIASSQVFPSEEGSGPFWRGTSGGTDRA